MKAAIVALLAAVAASPALALQKPMAEYRVSFSAFKKQYGKTYSSMDEEIYRLRVFAQNTDFVARHTKMGKTYTVALNQFADMTIEEFKAAKLAGGFQYKQWRNFRRFNQFESKDVSALPTSVDWRTQNAVTPIKDQGQCGSCWAFSTTGALEGIVAIKTGTLTSFSEQQLVDCSSSYGNEGCNGGLMDQAFQYIVDKKGLCSEASYPYKAVDGSCKTCTVVSGSNISGYQDVAANSESSLQAAVAGQPVSVAIEADTMVFQFYSGGILSDPSCGTQLDHGVLAVGYGADSSGKAYWIVKNSWGNSWGEQGYIRLARNVSAKQGECGIAMQASFPTKN